ncbi:uncharacterized protein [Arachis hypogaea]|uniref:uncharacterized protein n=1 Tax=Arachis hypogaea TaxID=3818 RepID=UPI003B20E979
MKHESCTRRSLEAIFGVKQPIAMVSILPEEYSQIRKVESLEDDCYDVFPGSECLLLDDNMCGGGLFEKPTENDKEHLRPLHIKARVDGRIVNKILVDGGAAVNLMPERMMRRLGKTEKELIKSSIGVTDFNGRTSSVRGVVLLSIEIGSVNRPTLFVVVPSKAGFNLLLGRDWIHGMGAIPSTLHQKLIFWNEDGGVEEVPAHNSTCYYDEMHVEFRIYNPGVKPLTVNTKVFNPESIEMCKIDMNGFI